MKPFSHCCVLSGRPEHGTKMKSNPQPQPNDFRALGEIINGKPADRSTMKRLVDCNLVEEFDGTALLTESGIRAAEVLTQTD